MAVKSWASGDLVNAADLNRYENSANRVINVRDTSGVVGDGDNDDTTGINTALAALTPGTTLSFPAGTYKITNTLTIPSGVTLDMTGSTIDGRSIPVATALNQRIAFSASGSVGTALTVSTAITQWTSIVAGISSTATLAAGDLVIVQNNEAVAPGARDDDNVTITWRKGELNKIVSVDSSSQVTLWTPHLLAYGTSGLTITKVTPVNDVVLRGGTLLLGGTNTGHNAMRITYAHRFRVENMVISGAEDEAIALTNVYDAVVSHCHITDGTSPDYLGKSTGYGIAVLEGSRFVRVESNYIRNTRHAVAGGGTIPPSFVDVVGNHAQETIATSFECHEPGIYWNYRGNTSVGAGDRGIQYRGQHGTVEGNTIIDAHSDGISIHSYNDVTEQDGIVVRNNRIYNCNAGIGISGQNDQAGDPNSMKNNIVIDGNYIDTTVFAGINLTHFTGASIRNNDIRNHGTDAIVCTSIVGDTQSTDVLLEGNHVWSAGGKGITVTNITGVTINDCRVIGANTSGYLITTCSDVSITGSQSKGAVNFGISLVTCTNVTITGGAYVDATTSTNGHGIKATGSTDVTVVGTFTRNPGAAILTTTSNYITAIGNNTRNNGSGTKINLDASATNHIVANNFGATDSIAP